MGAADASVYSRQLAKVGDYSIPYLRGGRGLPLVYLHGLGGGGKWESYHMALANDTLAHALQLPGWQEGSPPAGVDSVEDLAELVVHFLDAVEIDMAILAGHSIGGWVAQYIAVNHPERVSRLMLIDSLGVDEQGGPDVDLGVLDEEAFGKAVFARLGLIASAQPYGFGAEFTNVRSSPEFERQWRGKELLAKLTRDGYSDPELTAKLANVSAETLIVWGALDRLVPLSHAYQLQSAIPNSQLALIEGAGHLPMVEKRETFHRVCHDFLTNIDAPITGVLRPVRATAQIPAGSQPDSPLPGGRGRG